MNVLIRPVFTEKSMKDADNSVFTFIVGLTDGKDAVKKAVEEAYGVKVLDIATSVVKGKVKRIGKKRTRKTITAYKKALVQVQKGQKIAEFELGEKKK